MVILNTTQIQMINQIIKLNEEGTFFFIKYDKSFICLNKKTERMKYIFNNFLVGASLLDYRKP